MNRELLSNAQRKISELLERAEVFKQDNGAINLDLIHKKLDHVDNIALMKLDR